MMLFAVISKDLTLAETVYWLLGFYVLSVECLKYFYTMIQNNVLLLI